MFAIYLIYSREEGVVAQWRHGDAYALCTRWAFAFYKVEPMALSKPHIPGHAT